MLYAQLFVHNINVYDNSEKLLVFFSFGQINFIHNVVDLDLTRLTMKVYGLVKATLPLTHSRRCACCYGPLNENLDASESVSN